MQTVTPFLRKNAGPIGLWIILRILLSAWAALVSVAKPLTPLESSISVWPPASPYNQWLERVFLSPWLRWDVEWYLRILSNGYQAEDGTAQFHPLLALAAWPFTALGFQPILALLLVSSSAGLLMLILFNQLARLDFSPDEASASTIFFMLFPPAIVLFAPYTESLFLLFSVLAILLSRYRRWWLAGLAGALASLARQQGIFLLAPIAWEMWRAHDCSLRRLLNSRRVWLSLALIPAGYAAWIVYRNLALNDFNLNFSSFHNLVYSLLISPSANQVVPVQSFLFPWQTVWLVLTKLWTAPDIDLAVNIVLAVLFLAFMGLTWSKMHPCYRLYSALIVLVSFSYYTGPVHPVMGLPRHLMLAFPVFIPLGAVLNKPIQRLILVGGSLPGMLFMLLLFVLKSWVP